MSDALVAAREIMALVDEYPSGPFSLERRDIEAKLEDLLNKFYDVGEEAKESYYQIGYDEGFEEGQQQAEQTAAEEISDLEDRIDDEKKESYDLGYEEGYSTGFEAAKLEY